MTADATAQPTGTVTMADEVRESAFPVPTVVVSAVITCLGTKYSNPPITRKITPNITRLVLIFFTVLSVCFPNVCIYCFFIEYLSTNKTQLLFVY
jgi:hypothetical protein